VATRDNWRPTWGLCQSFDANDSDATVPMSHPPPQMSGDMSDAVSDIVTFALNRFGRTPTPSQTQSRASTPASHVAGLTMDPQPLKHVIEASPRLVPVVQLAVTRAPMTAEAHDVLTTLQPSTVPHHQVGNTSSVGNASSRKWMKPPKFNGTGSVDTFLA